MFRIKYCREVALKLLYQIDVLEEKEDKASRLLQKNLGFFKGLNDTEKKFIADVIQNFIENKKKIDQIISRNLIGWKLKRLVTMDRNLIRMGIAESFFNDQKAIVIDDIVRIAKKYSEEESFKIINAILDKVIK